MRPSTLRAALLIGAALSSVSSGLQTPYLAPIPLLSPPQCQVEARWTGHRSFLGQYLIEISLPPTCPPSAGRLTRIRTAQGGTIPPVGYFRLGAGFPRKIRYYVLSPAYVMDRYAPNDWRPVPIFMAPWRTP